MSIAQTIYTTLRAAGLTEAAALGMLGNWQCESGLEANRVQGDFSPYRTVSKDYVRRAESGQMTKEEFCKPVGVFLAQWTYPARKAALWEFWKKSGTALDDAVMQTKFALSELINDYPGLMSRLRTETDLYTCTKLICEQYERPAINNIDARFSAAKSIKAQLDTSTETPIETPTDGWETIPATDYWPPRTICEGMIGKDVVALRGILYARGYDVDVDDDDFDKALTAEVKSFQNVWQLDQDGIVGPLTWSKLLDRG